MTDLVLHGDVSGVRTLTLNRPDRRNAMDVALLRALRVAVGAAADDPDVRCVVVTGAGKGFCAGADVDEWADVGADGADDLGRLWEGNAHAVMQELYGLPKPTLALLNGAAVGAGLDLACCCDFRVASDAAKIACAYTWIGYSPDAGGTWLYPRLLRPDAAKRLVFTGEVWDAQTALRHGLVSEVVPAAELSDVGQALAQLLAAGPTVALGHAKRLMHEAPGRGFAEQLAAEAEAGRACAATEDHREGLRAAAERRAPVFKGR
jgi:2-(1,2-epoxy-1,2-dihydrophenyl)acetyl-CoA isomerase